MHLTVAGASGYVGSVFAHQVRERGHRLSTISQADTQGYQVDQVRNRLLTLSPDFLVNCAGYTGKPNVDACESDKAACLAGNAVLPGVLAEVCNDLSIPWGHVSSGCIFTGRRSDGTGFTESDPPNFSFRQNHCSFYSGSKALGEEVLDEYLDRCYVWRLRIPFSKLDSGRNYLSKLLRYDRLLDAENSLSELDECVGAALDCVERDISFGTYHLTNPGSVTAREVVDLIHESGVSDKQFDFFDSEDEFMTLVAKTPRSNCVLDSSKALDAGLKLSPVREAIRRALENWVPETTNVAKSD